MAQPPPRMTSALCLQATHQKTQITPQERTEMALSSRGGGATWAGTSKEPTYDLRRRRSVSFSFGVHHRDAGTDYPEASRAKPCASNRVRASYSGLSSAWSRTMTISRSSTPFFHRAETHHSVEAVASERPLVIFAGAGVTIDRTGLNWRALLHGLLKKADVSEADFSSIVEYATDRSDMQFASIVRSLYRRKGDEWRRLLAESVHALLYSERSWRGGRYANAIAEIVVARVRRNLDVLIFTTNHDEFIELAIRAAAKRRGVNLSVASLSLEFREAGRKGRKPRKRSGLTPVVQVVHLHGGIKKEGRRDGKHGSIVLGEYDFFDYEENVAELVSTAIASRNTLIVGAGMDDPNLLRGLHRAKKARSASRDEEGTVARASLPPDPKTWVVMTAAGVSKGGIIEDSAVKRAQTALTKRLGEFDVEPILPDNYAQAHQFLLEVAEETRNSSDHSTYSDDDAVYRYGKRLRAWWTLWEAESRRERDGARNSRERQLATQNDDHNVLLEVADRVRQVLTDPAIKIQKTDHVKVEVWLRWDPNETSRKLQLWATSLGPWASYSAFKEAEYSTVSPIAAVNAVCSGTAELLTDVGGRWDRYLAVPIEVAAETHQSVIVGAVVVAVSRQELLTWRAVKPMRRLVEDLPAQVAPIVNVGDYRVVTR